MALNTATLGGKPVYDAPDGIIGVNRFVMRTGASRYGKGVFAMRRQDYDDLVTSTASTGGTTTLVLKGDPGPGLTLSVVLAGAEPMVTAVGSDPSNDLMKVSVYDLRSKFFTPINKSYNVQVDGFPLDGSNNPICFTSTIRANKPPDPPGFMPWTWKDLLVDAEIMDPDSIPNSIPDWTPYNIIWDGIPAARAVDDVASQMFYVVGFDHQETSLVKSIALFPPYQSARGIEKEDTGFSANDDLVTQVKQKGALLNGAFPGSPASTERNNNRLPGKIAVVFPGVGDSNPFSAHRNYTKQITTGFGQTSYTVTLNIGNQIGVWSGTAWTNQTTLDDVATDLGARAAIFISQIFGEAEYAGIWPFRPDGRIRQIEWVSYPKGHPQEGARTIIRTDNARDWLPIDSLNDPVNLTCNQEVIGLGLNSSSIDVGGTKFTWNRNAPVRLVIASPRAQPGTYIANPLVPIQTFAAGGTAAITLANIGTTGTQDVLAINMYELNKDPTDPTQWDLDVGQVFLGTYLCQDDENPSKAVYTIEGLDPGNCSG